MKSRIYGLDLIRSAFLIAVVHFHSHEALFFTHGQTFRASDSISPWLEPYSRALSFGGQVLVFLFALLAGMRNKSLRFLTIFLSVAVLVLTIAEGRPFLSDILYEWDIYSYVLFCVVVVELFRKYTWSRYVFFYGGLGLLTVPWWKLVKPVDSFFFEALIGSCPPEASGAWPLLPWSGLFLAAFAAGQFIYQSDSLFAKLQKISYVELSLWVGLMFLSIPYWGAYYDVDVGDGFYCYVLRQSPFDFFVHFVWVLGLARLSLIKQVNAWIGQSSWVRLLSQSMWNQAFGMCYLTHFIFLGWGSLYKNFFLTHPRVYDLFVLGLFVVTDILVRVMLRVRDHLKQHYSLSRP